MKKLITITFFLSLFIFVNVNADEHQGDYTVKSGQTLTIKDETLEVDGNFFLEEGSTLIMENAVLIIKERYKSEHLIDAKGATITLTNSEIKSSGSMILETYGNIVGTELNIRINEKSNLEAKDSRIYGRPQFVDSTGKIENSIISFVYWMPSSDLEIYDSTIGHTVLRQRARKV